MAEVAFTAREDTRLEERRGASSWINIMGGVVSLGLIAGVCVWGYELLSRDVSGVPVVQAIDGPMRVAPESPGGREAEHQGLAVNEVPAAGGVGAPRDRFILATQDVDLTDEDAPQALLIQASVDATSAETPPEEGGIATTALAPAETTDLDALLEELTSGSTPLEPVAPSESTGEVVASLAPPTLTDATGASPDGLARSLRPQLRPASLKAAAAPRALPSKEIAASAIPSGTHLIQLGAFASPEIARAEWERLNESFGVYMDGKKRVVQKAEKAGRTFYRLRAQGFEDISDARRLCSTLVAQGAACIPVIAD